MAKTKMNIRRLKAFALVDLPEDWALRDILLTESTEVEVFTFLNRLTIWLELSRPRKGDSK